MRMQQQYGGSTVATANKETEFFAGILDCKIGDEVNIGYDRMKNKNETGSEIRNGNDNENGNENKKGTRMRKRTENRIEK